MWFISFGEDISVGPCESPVRAGEAVTSNEFCLLKQVKLQWMQSPRCYLLLLKGTETAQCQGKSHRLLPSVLLFPNRREYSHNICFSSGNSGGHPCYVPWHLILSFLVLWWWPSDGLCHLPLLSQCPTRTPAPWGQLRPRLGRKADGQIVKWVSIQSTVERRHPS